MAYKTQINTRRVVWISESFITDNMEITNCMLDIISRPGSKWVLCSDLPSFRKSAEDLNAKKKGRTALAFITPEKVTLPDLAAVACKFSLDDAISFFDDIDLTRTSS